MSFRDFVRREPTLAAHTDVIDAWYAALNSEADGAVVCRNLDSEAASPRCDESRRALHALAGELGSQPAPTAAATGSLRRLFVGHEHDILCQGTAVPAGADTTTLAKLTPVAGLRLWQGSDAAREPKEDDQTWLDRLTLGRHGRMAAAARAHLQPDAAWRGVLPLVFATPYSDRTNRFPPGTHTDRAQQLVGLEPDSSGRLYCVVTWNQEADRRGHIPTGIDAHDHPFFWPAALGAEWGVTWDKASPDSARERGVRECVVRSFNCEHLSTIEAV
ncbi:MAG: hypothetical protein U0821_14135 [Chloroflexota bacterium]